MPRIPLSEGPRLQSNAQQGGYLRAPDVSQTARALATALGQASDAAGREAMRQGEAEANKFDAENGAAWMEWDAKARREFQGEKAPQYKEEAAKWWGDVQKNAEGAVSPIAKGLLSQSLARRRAVALGNVSQYAEAELERHADQTAQGAIDTAVQFGVTNNDPAGAAAQVRTLTAQVAARKGWKTEQLQAEQTKQLSSLHLAYITKLASNDAAAAQTYFEANKPEVSFTQQQRVQEVLKGEADNQAARKDAAAWADLPYEQQLKKASEIADPQRRDKTLQTLQAQHGMVKAARQEREQAAADGAWQLVARGKPVPESVLSVMDGRERVQLKDYLRQRAEHSATQGNKPVVTDPATHRKLWALMGDDPEAFKKERLDAHGMKLSGADFEQLVKLQADMRKPGKPAKDLVSFNNKVQAAIELNGWTGTKDDQKRGAFRRAAQMAWEQQTADGKVLPPKAEDELLDALQMPGKTNWWNSTYAETYAESVRTGKPFQIKSDADFAKLPPGAVFVAPDGTTRKKP